MSARSGGAGSVSGLTSSDKSRSSARIASSSSFCRSQSFASSVSRDFCSGRARDSTFLRLRRSGTVGALLLRKTRASSGGVASTADAVTRRSSARWRARSSNNCPAILSTTVPQTSISSSSPSSSSSGGMTETLCERRKTCEKISRLTYPRRQVDTLRLSQFRIRDMCR